MPVAGQENCPSGYIKRKGYTRRFKKNVVNLGFTRRKGSKLIVVHPKSNATIVKATCIRNRGLPGKGPLKGEGIGKLRKGELIKYGYTYKLPNSMRHAALKRAVSAHGKTANAKKAGATAVYRKLNAVAKLSVRTAPDASKIFARDRNWVHREYME
jgi:hypothetical protein